MAEEYLLARPVPITISAEDVDRLLSLGSGDAALLYLWLLKNGGRLDRERASRELKVARPIPALLALLRQAGLIRGEAPEPQMSVTEPPKGAPEREQLSEPTVEEIRREASENSGFSELLTCASELMGKVLGGGDMKILYGIYHELGLPAEVVRLMLSFCAEDVRRRFGPGRKPTIRQIEKEAYVWAREELFDLDLAERWVKSRTVRSAEVEKLCETLGIRGRRLAPSEEKFLGHWLDMGFGAEAVLLAYDRTVAKKGELHWNYMNRILESWHGKGLHAVAEIREKDLPPGKAPAKAGTKAAGPTTEEFERMQKLLNKMNGGGENGT